MCKQPECCSILSEYEEHHCSSLYQLSANCWPTDNPKVTNWPSTKVLMDFKAIYLPINLQNNTLTWFLWTLLEVDLTLHTLNTIKWLNTTYDSTITFWPQSLEQWSMSNEPNGWLSGGLLANCWLWVDWQAFSGSCSPQLPYFLCLIDKTHTWDPGSRFMYDHNISVACYHAEPRQNREHKEYNLWEVHRRAARNW